MEMLDKSNRASFVYTFLGQLVYGSKDIILRDHKRSHLNDGKGGYSRLSTDHAAESADCREYSAVRTGKTA